MNSQKLLLIRIIIALIISLSLFLIFSITGGLFAFIILLFVIASLDILQLLINRKFRLSVEMLVFYILLFSGYYYLIDSGLLR